MNPSEAKKRQREDYDLLAREVASGKVGYMPAKKSRYSKTYKDRFSHSLDSLLPR